jgi:hypothetical protein
MASADVTGENPVMFLPMYLSWLRSYNKTTLANLLRRWHYGKAYPTHPLKYRHYDKVVSARCAK